MCVVSHGNVGLGWCVDKARKVVPMSGDAGALPECEVIH